MSNVRVLHTDELSEPITTRLTSYTHFDDEGFEVIEGPPEHPIAREAKAMAVDLRRLADRFDVFASEIEALHA